MHRSMGRANHAEAPPPPPVLAAASPGKNDSMETTLSCLWVLTPLMATLSVVVVLVAVLTNQWLHTVEKMANVAFNGTGDREYLSKSTVSGLWMFCYTNPGETLYECSKIDYFSKEEYSPDPNDSTLAIPYTVTKSVLFFLASSVLLGVAYSCCVLGQCYRHRTLYTFVSGVVFIITGLVMLFGLIMYISIFKAEIGSKLRPRSQLQPAAFEYWYGYSFLLYVTGLISTQVSGISSIFLFIYRLQSEWRQRHHEELKRGAKRPEHQYHNHHSQMEYYYPCRRHPQAYVNSNSAIQLPVSPVHQKRYYFSKEPVQESPCSVHRTPPIGGTKDLTSSNFYDFPPPPTISYQFDDYRGFPRDLTANTVSTTADVVNCDDYLMDDPFDEYSPAVAAAQQHEFVTFDLDQSRAMQRASSALSLSSRNGLLVGVASMATPLTGASGDTLRRTTPV